MATRYTVAGTVAGVVLGGAALLSVGTSTGTVAAGDDSRITGAVQASTLSANGDLLIRASGVPTPLHIGSSGYVLTVSGSAPVWAAASSSTRGSGTLAARPASPAAGDTYAITSGTGLGDRYECFVATVWTLISYTNIGGYTPTLWWRLNEASGTTAANSGSASSADLTITGSPSLRGFASPRSRGLVLDADTRYARGYTTTPTSATAFSTCAVVNPTIRTGSDQPILLRVKASPAEPYSWHMNLANGKLRIYYHTLAAGAVASLDSVVTIPNSVPAHICGVWSAGTVTSYINGAQVATASPGSTIVWQTTGSPAWNIGLGAASQYAGAIVADAQFYDGTALGASDVAELAARALGTYEGQ